jgi:hypothetical protein
MPDARFAADVTSCSDCQTAGVNMASVQRQRQLPSVRPGWFMRASSPRFSRSCSGAMASAAG